MRQLHTFNKNKNKQKKNKKRREPPRYSSFFPAGCTENEVRPGLPGSALLLPSHPVERGWCRQWCRCKCSNNTRGDGHQCGIKTSSWSMLKLSLVFKILFFFFCIVALKKENYIYNYCSSGICRVTIKTHFFINQYEEERNTKIKKKKEARKQKTKNRKSKYEFSYIFFFGFAMGVQKEYGVLGAPSTRQLRMHDHNNKTKTIMQMKKQKWQDYGSIPFHRMWRGQIRWTAVSHIWGNAHQVDWRVNKCWSL